jgi:ferritin-like metal-binding protein YciE
MIATSSSIAHDALVGEVRGLYGAERQLLHSLGAIAQAVHIGRVKLAVLTLVTSTGNRLWRLEEAFGLLDEELCSRHSLGMERIVETKWSLQRHRLQHDLLELHIVGTTLQEALAFLAVVYAVAAARARSLGYTDVTQRLSASQRDAEAMSVMVATHTGVRAPAGAAAPAAALAWPE